MRQIVSSQKYNHVMSVYHRFFPVLIGPHFHLVRVRKVEQMDFPTGSKASSPDWVSNPRPSNHLRDSRHWRRYCLWWHFLCLDTQQFYSDQMQEVFSHLLVNKEPFSNIWERRVLCRKKCSATLATLFYPCKRESSLSKIGFNVSINICKLPGP